MTEPKWLRWARALQSIAQTGAFYTENPYDVERYDQIERIAAEMLAEYSNLDLDTIVTLYAEKYGPDTPKVDVRGAVIHEGKILLVQEVNDGHRWTLPGGWADPNESAGEATVREVFEETGYHVTVKKLVALYEKGHQDHPPDVFTIHKAFFLCDLVGGEAKSSLETGEAGWFKQDELPENLSLGRTSMAQLACMFAHYHSPELPTEFD